MKKEKSKLISYSLCLKQNKDETIPENNIFQQLSAVRTSFFVYIIFKYYFNIF